MSDASPYFAQAVQALAAKDRGLARRLLAELVRTEPAHEQGWLMLATLMEDVNRSVECLQRALALNPNNAKTQHWLTLASRQQASQAAAAEAEAEEKGFVELDEADKPVPRLGRLLLDFKFVTPEQLEAALEAQRAASERTAAPTDGAAPNDGAAPLSRIGDILLAQGALTAERLAFAVREQNRLRASLRLEPAAEAVP